MAEMIYPVNGRVGVIPIYASSLWQSFIVWTISAAGVIFTQILFALFECMYVGVVCLMSKEYIGLSKINKTRKLIYRKDDRTMRPCGCPKNFREFLTTPTATFAEIFNGLLFRSIL